MSHRYFRLEDGRVIKHYSELPSALQTMDDDSFNSHVNENKNDFKRWISDVFGHDYLAGKLEGIRSKEEMARVIAAHIKPLSNAEVKFVFKAKPKDAPTSPPQEEKKIEPSVKKDEPSVTNMPSPAVAPTVPVASPVIEKTAEQKSVVEEKVAVQTNQQPADKYFKENPVLVSQRVEAKKESLNLEKMNFISYDEHDQYEKRIELFKDAYPKVYSQMQFLRKNGFDTSLIEMMVQRIPSKIKLYEASHEEKDAVIIKRYLNEAIEEMNGVR
ncbi:MAG: hypothetical protein NDI94_04240 [Candidatus Woesearchaeota archaeon]|nr:hypothetical protein [Candidatus Woesearchaeota archaeon]